MTPTIKEIEKKQVEWLKYINTGLLTIILGTLMLIFNSQTSLHEAMESQKLDIAKLSVTQTQNVQNVTQLQTRVTALETENLQELKQWIDDNYVRKPQK